MSKHLSRCIVCGVSPTVKSHLFPRALMLDLRQDAKALVQGQRGRDGYTLPQNGEWDDTILCKRHEDLIGAGDDYAVEWIRRGVPEETENTHTIGTKIENPRPDLLMHFIYATVWRVVVSRAGQRSGLDLGRYEPVIRQALLQSGPYDLEAVIGISHLGLREVGRVPFALYPYRQKFGQINSWHFVICGFDFHLLTDQRRVPKSWHPYIVNGNSPLIVTTIPLMDLREIPSLRPLLSGMLRGPRPASRRKDP